MPRQKSVEAFPLLLLSDDEFERLVREFAWGHGGR
jgi:hypothetical protein